MWGINVGFIGLGKLGMPCAEAMVDKGFEVTGYDSEYKSSFKVNISNDILDCVKDGKYQSGFDKVKIIANQIGLRRI